ncbi:MAG: chromosome partitioning protein ParB [Betaproteobacteria bacterium RIFCSPLOWO2_12_FULL_62_13]|nr:MAG: chromosome partitioning protein ParB [Betaproteobacteria bacterium RIFCSPLOWO2_12_FULL_62_13]
MVKMRGLGRGLDALLGGDDERVAAEEQLRSLPIDSVQPGKYQPRTRMDQEALGELAESIRAQGIMQPILVRPLVDGRYEIIAGERRWRAARIAGLGTVPALVRDVPDRQALAVSLIENIQRENLNPLEEATGIQRLIQEFGMTHAEAAQALGRSRSGVTNLLRLLDLAPPVRELLAQGRLDMGHARALLTLPVARQVALAREAVAKQLSVRDVERRASAALKQAPPARRAHVDRDIARLEEDLSDRLGTTVQIRVGAKQGSGRLIISYRSLDQLDALLARLTPVA